MNQSLFFTIDLEDFRYLRCRELGIPPRSGSYYVESGIEQIRTILAESPKSPKITFFTTAQIARDQKNLIEKLVEDGHEIACHSFEHEKLPQLTPVQLKDNIKRATAILEDAAGQKILGFRAPSFRPPKNLDLFFEILVEEGYQYDSSVLVTKPNQTKNPYLEFSINKTSIIEFPVFRYNNIPGISIRVVGGTYFRFIPLSISNKLLKLSEKMGYIPNLWLHPVDLCPDFQPIRWSEAMSLSTLEALKWPFEKISLQTGVNSVSVKLKIILSQWQLLGTMGEYVSNLKSLTYNNRREKSVVNF